MIKSAKFIRSINNSVSAITKIFDIKQMDFIIADLLKRIMNDFNDIENKKIIRKKIPTRYIFCSKDGI